MKLTDRIDMLEKAMVKHLEESGEIRADLKWLKKMMWFVMSGLCAAIVERLVTR